MASQCLQTAFCLSAEDEHLGVKTKLEDMFAAATAGEPVRTTIFLTFVSFCLMISGRCLFQLRKKGTPPPEDKEKAEKLKLEGNDLMRSENFEQAVEKYTR